ncbi:MAG TPA: hypothetical protein VGI13_14260 [Candidatus Acidoferrum sp.]
MRVVLALVLLTTGAWTLGCGGGGAGSVALPAPTPPSIQITIAPNSSTVLLGETVAFAATVSNSTNTAVSWSVNGIPGGSAQVGSISADGVFTAPEDLPQGGTVQVTATSNADSSKFASASINVSSDISVSLAPGNSSVELGGIQSFHASIASSGRPDPTIQWSLSGGACPNSCGSIDSSGNYTAPQILPNPPFLTATATSAADPTKHVSVSLTVTSNFSLQLAGPTNLRPGITTVFVATMTPAPNSKPSSVLTWSLSGSGCNGNACGVLNVVTTQSSGATPIADTANYTAPLTVPQPDAVIVTVTPLADSSKKAQVSVAIQSLPGGSIAISPSVSTLAASRRTTLTATTSDNSGASLAWSVNGIPGGNTSVGMICVSGSSPCQPVTSGTSQVVDFIAPGSIPSQNPVSVSVTSTANASETASAQITVINHVLVSVTPSNITLLPLAVQAFSANVLGGDDQDQDVVWQIQGSSCSGSNACGYIDAFGNYTAPAGPPAPNTFHIIALSRDDSSQSAVATVSISNALNVLTLQPSSVYAGAANGFTLRVVGSGFIPSNPGPGSTLFVAGAARFTTCSSANSCSAPLTSSDVQNAGSVSARIQNPDQSLSNTVQLKVVAPATTESIISLTSAAPAASGKDITVVDLSTSGIDTAYSSLDLDVAAIGAFATSTNTCSLAGNPIPLLRPANGFTAADVCLFSSAGFDASMNYVVSGPGDVTVISKQPAGLGIIHLTLQIPASAAPGARTLFIQNANLDQTAATGVLEVR